jgi:mannosyltransferase
VAAFVFVWQLGSSSLFLDEVGSVKAARVPLSALLDRLHWAETNPGGYFAFLHVWTAALGSQAVWLARLPSALAGIALVPVVWKLGSMVAGRASALVAAALTSISPFVLEYAQQARAYTLATLAMALAAIAAIQADRLRSWRWTIGGALAAAVALSFHYATAFLVAPLCVWMLLRRRLERRMLAVFCALPALAWLAWLPLFVAQRRLHPDADLGMYGRFTASNVARVVAAPFDDRYSTQLSLLKVCAAAVVAGLIAWALARSRRPGHPEMRLMLALAITPLLALALLSGLGGTDVMNSRYMAFAVPFVLVIVGAAITRIPKPVAVVATGVLIAAAVAGDLGSHRREGFYPDARGVADAVAARWRPGDALLYQGDLGLRITITYYGGRRLPAGAPIRAIVGPGTRRPLAAHPRVWVTWDERYPPDFSQAPLRNYRRQSVRRFPGSIDLLLAAAVRKPGLRPVRPAARR